MEQYDLNQIRNFVRLVQAGSFTKAASLLRQPKSRISRHLAALENVLGSKLVHRTTRQFQLTEMGRSFYDRAQGLIDGLESISSEVRHTSLEISGEIKLTAPADLGVGVLPKILDDFNKIYPRIQFEVILSQTYLDLVRESIDFAIRVGKLKDSTLRAKKVGLVKNIFVASPSFIERLKLTDEISGFSSAPFLSLNHGSMVEAQKISDSKKVKILVAPKLVANNPEVLVEMAHLGRGFAFVPEFLCVKYLKSGRLLHVLKHLKGAETPIQIVTPHQKDMPLKLRKFMEFLALRLQEELSS